MPLKSGLILILFLFTLQATRIKDVTGDDLILGIRNVKYRHFLRSPQSVKQTSGRVSLSLDKHRAKRSAVFSTGVKVCPQESMSEVTTSHKAYYKLRVCQEAVWEAFRIFLDRVPDTMEYQQWVYACQRDSLCMEDLARNFTSTQEHLDMVASRVNDQEQERVLTSEPGEKCSKSPAELSIMESDSETGAPAVVTQKLEEHIVEFTVTVVDPIYSALLRDPGHPQYEHLTQNPHKQMLHVFDKLPGFKAIQVLGLSETEEATVTYAVVFETDETQGHSEITEEKSIDRVLRSMVVKALQEEFSLPVDLHSLTFKKDVPTTAGLEITTSASQSNGDSDILPGETTTRFTQAFPVNPFTPSRSSGIHLRDQILVEAQTAMGELAESSVLQKEPGVPTLVEVTEKKWSNTNTESAITKGTLIIEGPLRTTTVDYLSKTVQKEVENEIVATAATSGRDSFEVTKASPSTQGEMDFDMTAETSSVEATSPIVVASPAPTEQNAIDVFENAIISPTQAIDVNLSNPTGQTESLDLDTAIDPVEALTVQATIETLHHKVLPVGLATPKAILTSSLPTQLAPTEAAIVRMTPDNLLDDEGKPLRTILPPLGGATDENMHKNTEQSDEMEGSLDNGSGILDEIDEDPKSAGHLTTPSMMASNQGKELVVFFSLRVTNLMFSEDLFNKSSPEYKSLENTFLELLLPYLQSNLTGFKELEILNFRNGSVVVNSKLKLNKPVEYNVTEKVQCVLEDVCNAASERLDMEIDSQSLDVEAADDGDPCKFMACNEFSRCVVNALTAEPECLCHPGFSATDHLPCASLCDLEPEYCLNGGSCEIVAGHGVTCRCPVGKFWHYHGERCSELVSLPVDPLLLVACLVGTLSVVCGVIGILIFINKKCIRTRKTMRLVRSQSPFDFGNTMRINPVFESEDGVLTRHVSSILCPMSSDPSRHSGQGTFRSIDSIPLSIEIPRQLYTRRSEKLVSEMVDFHQCIPHNESWRSSSRSSCCLLRTPESESFDITVL